MSSFFSHIETVCRVFLLIQRQFVEFLCSYRDSLSSFFLIQRQIVEFFSHTETVCRFFLLKQRQFVEFFAHTETVCGDFLLIQRQLVEFFYHTETVCRIFCSYRDSLSSFFSYRDSLLSFFAQTDIVPPPPLPSFLIALTITISVLCPLMPNIDKPVIRENRACFYIYNTHINSACCQ